MRLVYGLLALVVLCGTVWGQYTASFANGVFWKSATPGEKLAYLRGIAEGMANGQPVDDKAYPWQQSLNQISASLDRVYEDPDNRIIRVRDALVLVSFKIRNQKDWTSPTMREAILRIRKIDSDAELKEPAK
ncbi:MAG: hypothetical protein LAP40_22975 [Acidobacteriia bacterium]|nr:hypothetical protein [Terriglobia bacterium]